MTRTPGQWELGATDKQVISRLPSGWAFVADTDSEADARLIAAAPHLLEEWKDLVQQAADQLAMNPQHRTSAESICKHIILVGTAAIAKATATEEST
jgi:hypothetical protein